MRFHSMVGLALLALPSTACGEASRLDGEGETLEAPQEGVMLERLPGVAPDADAQATRPTLDLKKLLDESEVAFEGEVVAIDYAKSEPSTEGHGVAHTFVTYVVDTPLKRAQAGQRLTLRFLGGPNGDGTELISSLAPRFELGDRDILFVTGNGRSVAPLTGGRNGRLRILEDRVYTDAGVPLQLDAALGQVRLYLESLHPRFRAAGGGSEPEQAAPTVREQTPDATPRAGLLDFLAAQRAPLTLPATEYSLDPRAPFSFRL